MTQQISLDGIQDGDRAALSAMWKQLYDQVPPPNLSQPLMRMILSFECQLESFGGLSRSTKRAIQILQKQNLQQGEKTNKARSSQPAPGTRLMREWNGKTHVVERTAAGYEWDGHTYKSLSAVASAITGTHWSGPRFFGLQRGSQ